MEAPAASAGVWVRSWSTAWTVLWSSSHMALYTIRCRLTLDWPSNASATTSMLHTKVSRDKSTWLCLKPPTTIYRSIYRNTYRNQSAMSNAKYVSKIHTPIFICHIFCTKRYLALFLSLQDDLLTWEFRHDSNHRKRENGCSYHTWHVAHLHMHLSQKPPVLSIVLLSIHNCQWNSECWRSTSSL